MSKLLAVLKDEIRRLARKEVRAHTLTTKRAAVIHRHEIARLKRMVQTYEKRIDRLASQIAQQAEHGGGTDLDEGSSKRFSARSVRAHAPAAQTVGRRVREVNRSDRPNDLPMGAGQVSPAPFAIRGPDRRPLDRSAGGARPAVRIGQRAPWQSQLRSAARVDFGSRIGLNDGSLSAHWRTWLRRHCRAAISSWPCGLRGGCKMFLRIILRRSCFLLLTEGRHISHIEL